jgi:hypothetical protein
MSSFFDNVKSDDEEQVRKGVSDKINEVTFVVLDSLLSNL